MLTCPHCHGTKFERELVDLGVGQEEGSRTCVGCGWNEDDETKELPEVDA